VNEPLNKTLVDAADSLNSHGVRYALIGGMAASLRGQLRVTADVDMVIAADVAQGLRLADSLAASPFKPLFDGVAEVVERSFILPLRHRTTGVKVDLALGLSGFEQQLIRRASPLDVAGQQIHVAQAEDLIILKSLAGRPQDDKDLEGILMVYGDRLDWDDCLRVAAELEESLAVSLVQKIRDLRARADRHP
jgi:predicted nucleotidyltransferase